LSADFPARPRRSTTTNGAESSETFPFRPCAALLVTDDTLRRQPFRCRTQRAGRQMSTDPAVGATPGQGLGGRDATMCFPGGRVRHSGADRPRSFHEPRTRAGPFVRDSRPGGLARAFRTCRSVAVCRLSSFSYGQPPFTRQLVRRESLEGRDPPAPEVRAFRARVLPLASGSGAAQSRRMLLGSSLGGPCLIGYIQGRWPRGPDCGARPLSVRPAVS